MSSNKSITLIDRSRVPLVEWILSEESINSVTLALKNSERILVYMNRRGAFRSYICHDCSFQWICEHCDIALTYHTHPSPHLRCHHCNHTIPLPDHCSSCGWVSIHGIGVALQEVERFFRERFPQKIILRLDSDIDATIDVNHSPHIILATEFVLNTPFVESGLTIILSPENELTIPEFDIEERVYTHIRFLLSQTTKTIIETNIPQSPLINDIVYGNYQDFLSRTLALRKKYRYPPYTGIAYIEITEKSKDRLSQKTATLLNKLSIFQHDTKKDGELIFDEWMRRKRGGEYIDTIVIRSSHMEEFIAFIEYEILHNRSIHCSIRGTNLLWNIIPQSSSVLQ